MRFHPPKPLHGWRAFAGEVGIIVLGVLIALGAQQLVEDFHQRSELHDAEAAMTSEIRDDDLPQAFTRAVIHQCYGPGSTQLRPRKSDWGSYLRFALASRG